MKTYIKLFFTALLTFTFISCDDHFAEVNTNPNGVADVNPANLFAKAAIASLRNGISGGYDYRIAGQLGHFYVGVNAEQFVDKYEQDLSGGAYESLFSDEYKNKLRYYNEIMMLTAPGEKRRICINMLSPM